MAGQGQSDVDASVESEGSKDDAEKADELRFFQTQLPTVQSLGGQAQWATQRLNRFSLVGIRIYYIFLSISSPNTA